MTSNPFTSRKPYPYASPAWVAQIYLERFWDMKLPVDSAAIARAAGVRVLANSQMGSDIGWFHEVGGTPTIEINAQESNVRKRFAVAHELAHFGLRHGPQPRDSVYAFSVANREPLSIDANLFALELLMPAIVVDGLIDRRGISDFDRLVSMFNTSGCAMEHRLQTLGWL